MSFFNPFTELRHLRARTYRTTFGQKLFDTLRVFCGTIDKPAIFVGIFDYLTLGIPRLLTWFFRNLDAFLKTLNPKLITGKILVELSQLIILALKFLIVTPRLLFGVTMTIICFPLIGIIHALSMKKGQEIKESICNSQVVTDTYQLAIQVDAKASALQGYHHCFIYLVKKNELWGCDTLGNARHIPIEKNKDELFRTTFHVDQATPEVPIILFPQRNVLKQFLPPGAADPSESYLSVAERLKFQDTALENIKRSEITVDTINAEEITLSLIQNKKYIPGFFLSAKNTADRKLFQNIRQLNIGKIEETIEKTPGLEQQVSAFM